MKNVSEEELKKISLDIRKKVLEMVCKAGSGHPGGSLSAVDILVALYFYKLKIDSKNQKRSKKIQKLRYLIFEVRCLQPAEITQIAEALGQSLNTTRDQLRKLIKLDLVIRVPFEHHTLYGINGHFNTFIDDILNGLYE